MNSNFKRTNINKIIQRTGFSPASGEESDGSPLQKPTSIDFDIMSPNSFTQKIQEKETKNAADSSFLSNKSGASKKAAVETSSKKPVESSTKTPQKPAEGPKKTNESAKQTPQNLPPKGPEKTPTQNQKQSAQKEKATPAPIIEVHEVVMKETSKIIKEVKNQGGRTEMVKRSAPPQPRVMPEKDRKIQPPLDEKLKAPALMKKDKNTKKVDEVWRTLNGRIKNIEAHNPWECERGTFDETLEEARRKRQKFTDSIFVPSLSSLCNNPKQVKALYQNFNQWVRIPELYKGQEHAVFHSIDPNDIKQGELGNCYFLSALSSLAEKPERIQRLFEDQSINDQGCYYVRLCVDGIWRFIVVDDFTPCSLNNRPVFAQPRSEEGIVEFWVLLLEKAWAKVFGSYENIDAGFPEDVFFACTGAPSEKIETEDEEAWARLEEADKANFIMTAACGQEDMKIEAFERLGLVPDHAYSLIGVRTIKHPREGLVKLCEIRNPWGWASEEWSGKWSDSYKGWNDIPEIKKSLDLKDDGRFMMCFEDFKTFFDYVTVCRMHNDYYFVSYPFRTIQTSYSIRTFTLKEEGSFYLTLTQKDERYFRGSKSINYSYTVARIALGRKNSDGSYEYIDAVCDQIKNLTLKAENLDAGDYSVVVSVDTPQDKKVYDYVLSYYGSQDIDFDRVRYKDDSGVLERIMVEGGKGRVMISDKKKDFEYKCYVSLEEGIIVETYKNFTAKELTLNKDYSKIDKTRFVVFREDQNLKFKFKVEPQGTVAICSKILNIFDGVDSSVIQELKTFGFRNMD